MDDDKSESRTGFVWLMGRLALLIGAAAIVISLFMIGSILETDRTVGFACMASGAIVVSGSLIALAITAKK